MKHLWKILLLIPIIALFQITYSGPLGVDKIDVVDQNTIKVTLSENPNLKQGDNEGEITILNDIRIASALAKAGTSNEVEIILDKPLLPETSYSLLTVAGAVGSIDFTTPTGVEGYSQTNVASLEEQDIESIEIVDSTTLNVTYKQTVSAGKYDYKFLAESSVVSIEKPNFELPELLVRVEPPLVSEQDYIMMVIDLKDVDGNQLEFDTGIYDFKTPVFAENTVPDVSTSSGEVLPELNAAGENVSLQKETLIEEPIVVGATSQEAEANIAAVAAEVKETPATGTATWMLILMTLSINAFYFYSRRKKTQ